MSPDRAASDASIAILDNGTGMDETGLKAHWIVGRSPKERKRLTDRGRRTIGKFGIGKLAAYILGNRLTHITKAGGRFFSTTMDFSMVPKPDESVGAASSPVQLPLHELTEEEARKAVDPWLSDDTGRENLTLFGDEAEDSWTVAIISDLKSMAIELSVAKLRWVLSTAMPLRDDFSLYMNGQKVVASKASANQIGTWVLGKDFSSIPSPAPKELEVPALSPGRQASGPC